MRSLVLSLLPALALAQDNNTPSKASSVVGREAPCVLLNQHLAEGWNASGLDLKNQDAVFATVFSRLPDEVTVYPTENYYYWKLYIDGREIYGNIRLPSGRRENGVLSFGYSEFNEFPSSSGEESEISAAKYFTKGDGVVVTCPDPFTSTVEFRDKKVTFRFNQLPQNPPKLFDLAEDEKFLERSWDESSLQFFLIYNTQAKYFFWVLNEESYVPEHFKPLADDITVGKRSGFVFWVDKAHKNRKILATIRKLSVMRNDYYDGPFDQLADNYVDETNIRHYIEEAIPSFKGRIDKWGYFTDQENPSRVALSNYGNYYTFAEAIQFIDNAKKSKDARHYISRGGYPMPGEQPATPAPAAAAAGEKDKKDGKDAKDSAPAAVEKVDEKKATPAGKDDKKTAAVRKKS